MYTSAPMHQKKHILEDSQKVIKKDPKVLTGTQKQKVMEGIMNVCFYECIKNETKVLNMYQKVFENATTDRTRAVAKVKVEVKHKGQ